MSSDSYRRQAQQHQRRIVGLQHDKARESERIADLQRRISSASQGLARATSLSAAAAKQREIERYHSDIGSVQKKIAQIEEKIGQEQSKVSDAQKNVAREEDREFRDRQQKDDRRQLDHQREMRRISGKLNQHDTLHRQTLSAIERLAELPERIFVLFLAANPLDQQQLRLDEEARAIAEMIRKSQHRDAVKLESCWAVRPLDVLQAINEHKPRIVHFSGHGSAQDEIVFQDESGQTKLVSKEAIVQTMAASSSDIQLVFFNTCYSRAQAEAVVAHVDAAIGMNTSIGDEAARVFAAQFYSAIGFGLSVQRAFQQAKAALMLKGIVEHDTPELFVANNLDPDQLILVRPPNGDLP